MFPTISDWEERYCVTMCVAGWEGRGERVRENVKREREREREREIDTGRNRERER